MGPAAGMMGGELRRVTVGKLGDGQRRFRRKGSELATWRSFETRFKTSTKLGLLAPLLSFHNNACATRKWTLFTEGYYFTEEGNGTPDGSALSHRLQASQPRSHAQRAKAILSSSLRATLA